MRLRRGGVLFAVLAVGWLGLGFSCSLGTQGLGPNDADASDSSATESEVRDGANAPEGESSTPDVVTEASPQYSCNATTCGGACCQDQCVPRNCAGCSTGSFLCPYATQAGSNGYCASDCSGCAPGGSSAPVTCFQCGSGLVLATCSSSAAQCPTDAKGNACPCPSGSAADCVGPEQACVGGQGAGLCLTCGATGTDKAPCKSGMICNQASALCQ